MTKVIKFKVEHISDISKQYSDIRNNILKMYQTNILPPRDQVSLTYKEGYLIVTVI